VPCIERRRYLLALAASPAFAAGCGQAQPLAGGGRAEAEWDAWQRRAAERLVAANPNITYMGEVPAELFAIPILDVELARDGSVKRISVKRAPSNRAAQDTVKIAIDAVRRAAPYDNLSGLPTPWIWTEVFLFNDKRQFKPRTLDD
jgi:protein TonB